MKSKKDTLFLTLAIAILALIAGVLTLSMPQKAAACDYYDPCVSSYGGSYGYHPSQIRSVQYPIPRYIYYQNPAQRYNDSFNYVPEIYPIPRYIQTGLNRSASTAYSSYGNYDYGYTYPSLSYVPYNQTGSSYAYGNNSYNNQPVYSNYTNGNTGFTMSGGNQNYYGNSGYGNSNGGFVNTSGR